MPPGLEELEMLDAKQDMDLADQSMAKATEATKRSVLRAGDSDSSISIDLQSEQSSDTDSDGLFGREDDFDQPEIEEPTECMP